MRETDRDALINLGRLLATESRHMRFRSGNAPGADFLFSSGVIAVDRSRLQVVTPYKNHRASENRAADTVPLDDVELDADSEVVYAAQGHTNMKGLVHQYLAGSRARHAMKAAYILRDAVKVLGGTTLDGIALPRASFALFYDDLSQPRSGGTGFTMQVCEDNGVPFADQSLWMPWVEG